MRKSAYIRARVAPDLKVSAERVLQEVGISPTQAVTMLYKRIARDHEWSLELKIPNATTHKIFEETDKGNGIVDYNNINDYLTI